MKIIVLGSGVVGVTSAWYLARAGHEVTVVDRQPAAGMETSFANAGQVSPGYSAPWAAPGLLAKAVHWVLMHHRPLVLWPRPDARMIAWAIRLLANANETSYRVNKSRMVRIAEYSRDCLMDLRREIGLAYDHRERGTLQLFRTQNQLDHVGGDTAVLDEFHVPYEVLDREGCVGAEPALALTREKFVGGLRLPRDETGDAHVFTQGLAAHAEKIGVTFRYGVSITAIRSDAGRITEVVTDEGPLVADVYVVALGSYSPMLLRPLGITVPIYPVKGYSITVPITEPEMAPVSTVMDESYKVAITRLGDRIRVGGTAELAGYSLKLRSPRRETLLYSVGDLFPRGGDLAQAKFWTGLRPMTPDGTPVMGPTKYPNLWLNTGHGTLGWTMACGSGRMLADLISGRAPAIDASDLALSRYDGVAVSAAKTDVGRPVATG